MSSEPTPPGNGLELTPLQQSYFVIQRLKSSLDALQRQHKEPIAIIGANCRFPAGANDMEAYWRLLRDGVDAVQEVPPDRWDVDAVYDPDPSAPGKTNTRCAAFLDEVDRFDPLFFGISPREALSLDPQQRLLLEVSWEALERAGQVADRLVAERTGTFIGIGQMDYAHLLVSGADPSTLDVYAGTGNGFCFASGRLSYFLGLRGPNVAIDTACSSSLVAVHLACQSLRSRECDLALAGGVHLLLSPHAFIALTKLGALSPDGRCKTFDAAANGYGRGEGCGIVVLKRLSDALAAGDSIAAVIRGSAVNHDGASSGFTVPNGLAQQELIRRALDNAGVKPSEVGYVETHGTGTPLGDPIDIEALSDVFGRDRHADAPLIVGSVKTNIGHLEAASGIAGLLKVVLALQHGEIPPHLHFKKPNPHVRWQRLPVKIATARTPWDATGERAVAGVSAFGLSGTNAHVLLEAAPPPAVRSAFVDRPQHLLPISARSPKALSELAGRYEAWLGTHPDASLGDVCFTGATGRTHLPYRAAIVAASPSEMREQLAALASSAAAVPERSGQPPRIAFLFSGQGSQYVGMGRLLYETQPSFRATLDRCSAILDPHLDTPLLTVVYPPSGGESPLNDTGFTQPALFSLEYALAQLWMSWGVEPDLMMGHSVGEYVAACLAGVFSLEDGLKLVACRARLMQALPRGGAMAVVFGDERTVISAIRHDLDRVSIAALNAVDNTVISGDGDAVARIQAQLEQRGIRSTPLQVSHAFHSPLMEPMLAEFARVAREVRYEPPRKALVSNLDGQPATAAIATADYWVQHVRKPVQFAAGLATTERRGCDIFIEIGPKPALLAMARRAVKNSSILWLPSLNPGLDDWRQLLRSVANVYERGVRIDWRALDRDYDRRRVTLPTYPFQRQRYWLTSGGGRSVSAPAPAAPSSIHPLLGAQLRLPLSSDARFETRFTASSPAYLKDHQLFDTVVVPGASHVAMALCAAKATSTADGCVLSDLFFPQALVLDRKTGCAVQTILSIEDGRTVCRVASLRDEADERESDAWVVHFSANLQLGPPQDAPRVDREALLARCPHELEGRQFYSAFKTAGYGLGESFRWLASIWQGDGEALARLEPPSLPDRIESLPLDPGLIDSCFQLFAACWRGAAAPSAGDEIFIPFAIGQLQCHAADTGGELWCHTRLRDQPSEAGATMVADTQLFDSQGRVVAQIIGFAGRKASRKALLRSLQGDLSDALYELTWQPAPPVESSEPEPAAGTWLIFADRSPFAAASVALVERRGAHAVVVEPGAGFEQRGERHFAINPDDPEAFVRLLREVDRPSVVVHCWSGSASVLHFLRGLAASRWEPPPRLCLVTRNAVAAGPERRPLSLEQAPLWGLGRVIALEHPDLRCTRIDLESEEREEDARLLINELTSAGPEDQVVFRAGQRLVARLARFVRPRLTTGRYRLTMGAFGVLDDLHLAPAARRKPGPGEVEVRVRANGLNLRDVILGLGLFNEQLEKLGIRNADDVAFGFECAGEITLVGDGVTGCKAGDAVMGLALGGMNSHATVNAALIAAKPPHLTFEEAATIPLAFLSAHYSLQHLARLQPGERVLIHAAAGGVGQAAVQLAKRAGAEIFATASPPKWEHLRRQGIVHVMNSRNTEFADEIKRRTGGRGVDCVLNSLTGEFIPRSLEALATNGRFVELGRIGIWEETQIHRQRPDVSYFNFDLAQIAYENPALIGSMLAHLTGEVSAQRLAPLVHTTFAIEQAADAFRFMAQAKHVGKVVLSHMRQDREMIRAGSAYVITGGLGSLGIQLAEWMVSKGARCLVLAGRSQPSAAAEASLTRMRNAGATVSVMQADVSQQHDVQRVLDEARRLGPLSGIVHAAGILHDGVLLNQDLAQFQSVMAAKIDGARHLHALSAEAPLDFFICYSSMASLLGSPGQGNYAAANAYLDALAHHRRALGLPALTINWAAWDGAGMAARVDGLTRARWSEHGVGTIAADQGLEVLEQLWASDAIEVGVQPINWSRFMRQFPPGFRVPALEAFEQGDAGVETKSQFLETLEATPSDERLGLLQDEVRRHIASVLGLASFEDIELRGRLFDLGLDSLMAIELKTRLERTLGCVMRPTLAFDYPTVEALSAYFAQVPLARFFATTGGPHEEDVAAPDVSSQEDESEEAIAATLARELTELERAGGR
jgi:acyl transferase domain-containing protein/NADPH:quinone reductase-like Zn-dependent oxidoreductase/acyl carrier protein